MLKNIFYAAVSLLCGFVSLAVAYFLADIIDKNRADGWAILILIVLAIATVVFCTLHLSSKIKALNPDDDDDDESEEDDEDISDDAEDISK